MRGMKTKAELTAILRSHFESRIFSRGREYVRDGSVGNIKQTSQSTGHLHIHAVVQGSDVYETDMLFDPEQGEFDTFDCTCPYEDNCKHAAALGLVFIEQYAHEAVREHAERASHSFADQIADMMRDGALATDDIEEIITQLQHLKQRAQSSIIAPRPTARDTRDATEQRRQRSPSWSPHEYYLALSRWDGQISLHRKDNPYQTASAARMLERTASFSADEKEMLALVKNAQNTVRGRQPVDLGRVLLLAQAVGVEIRHASSSWYWDDNSKKPVTLNTAPQKLSAALRFEEAYHEGAGRVRPRFTLAFNARDADLDKYTFLAAPNHLLRVSDRVISLYPMAARLSQCIANMVRHLDSRAATFPFSDEDTLYINDIITEAARTLDLTTDLSPEYIVERYAEPKKILEVDFQSDEVRSRGAASQEVVDGFDRRKKPSYNLHSAGTATLAIRACVDYGFIRIDVVDSVMISSSGWRKTYKRRNNPYGAPDTHVIEYDGRVIRAAPINESVEVKLFAGLYNKNVLPNMKPRATVKTLPKIFDFHAAYWQKLEKQCRKIGCEIVFPHGTFSFTQGDFRADFSIDMHAENDWLAFDTECYLGDDKVTLNDIRKVLAGGHEFFQQADGRLLRITNREELERFIAMLNRFAEREGRFEGKLYHAPELQYIVTSSPYYNAERSKRFDAFCKAAEVGKPIRRVALSVEQRTLLRPYQRAGVEWLYFLRSYHFAGILADDMGLGKTVQTLVLLLRERVPNTPSLVICPKTLLYNWQAEAVRFTPALKVAVVDGTPAERAEIITHASTYDVLVTGYATYKMDAPTYKKRNITFNYCVLDEAQFIKNHATKNARIIKEVDSRWRLALTGTPLENSVSEIWSIFDFLMPGFLGMYKEFSERFHTPIMKHGDADALMLLRKKIACFMLRRTKEEVLPELPPKVVQHSRCHLGAAQNLLYQDVLERVKQDIWKTIAKKGFEKSRIHILAGLTKLRQICNHPNLLLKEKDHTKHASAKLDMFHELVEEVCENKRKMLVFSQFTGMLDILATELKAKTISYAYLSGQTRNRQSIIDEFNGNPDMPVFLISLKAGGTGLNLTAADTVIIFDPWWNPSVENQAIDRAHRIGQQRSVNVYKLITEGTIEEKIVALQERKRNLFDSVVGESKDIFKKLTWSDVQELFR